MHAADTFEEADDADGWRPQERVLFAGQATRAVRVRPRGFARMAGARLHPTGAHALFACPQDRAGRSDRRASPPRSSPGPAVPRRRRHPRGRTGHGDGASIWALVRALPDGSCESAATDAVSIALASRGLVRSPRWRRSSTSARARSSACSASAWACRRSCFCASCAFRKCSAVSAAARRRRPAVGRDRRAARLLRSAALHPRLQSLRWRVTRRVEPLSRKPGRGVQRRRPEGVVPAAPADVAFFQDPR